MAVSSRMVMGRAMAAAMNDTGLADNQSTPAFQAATENATFTKNLIASLVFAESKSIRTSTIILASFNVVAAFATAASILYDCYWASKRCNPKFKASKFCVSSIHAAETFPLVLSVGIVTQGIIFAGVSGEGLTSLFTHGCEVIAQFMWPALFIVPYIQLVFGLECAIRSLREFPFQPRGKYDVTICCSIIVLMLIGTWLPSHLFPEPDECFASLVWFVTRYAKLAFILLSVAGGLMLVSAVTIFTRLSAVSLIDQDQRIAASRMVYYMVVGIVSLAFVLPFFFSLIGQDGDIKLGMMATVVLNLSGLMSGLLQLFLRSNTTTTSFGPTSGKQWDRKKHQIKIFGPNELVMQSYMVDPIRTPIIDRGLSSRAESKASLVGEDKGRTFSMKSMHSPPFRSPVRPLDISDKVEAPSLLHTPRMTSPARTHAAKPSYSPFPPEPRGASPKSPQQPYSIYDISGLEPPPQLLYTQGPRHRRDSSMMSSATVQIGLRISNAPLITKGKKESCMPLPSTTYAAPAPPSTKQNDIAVISSTVLPAASYKQSPLPASAYAATSKPTPPSPLRLQTKFSPSTPPHSPLRPRAGSASKPVVSTPILATSIASPSINKILPPTPKAFLPRESGPQLSPAVYLPERKSPERKLPAKVDLGLDAWSGGPRSATLPRTNPLRTNPPGNVLARTNSSANLNPVETDPPGTNAVGKSDWI